MNQATIRPTDVELSAPVQPGANPGVVPFIAKSVERAQGCVEDPNTVDREASIIVPIGQIRRWMRPDRFDVDVEITVGGAFFPAMLLCTGWWEGEHGGKLAERIDWQGDDLKQWLFAGFEEWGPSCDFNPTDDRGDSYLLAQLGERDEADSLLLIVAGSKAADLRAQLASGAQAFNVCARGFLRHPRYINEVQLRRRIEQWGVAFNYCLFVSGSENGHFAKPHGGIPARYSGYLWQCWLPRSLAQYSGGEGEAKLIKPPRLEEVYFLWEHTNLAKRSAVAYNLDSLRHKTGFLTREKGELILLQKSSRLIEGEQALSEEDFYKFIIKPTPNVGSHLGGP